jgi:hypothetical protein
LADKPRITRFTIDWGLGLQTEETSQNMVTNNTGENNLQSDENFLLDKTNLGEDKTNILVKDLDRKMGGDNSNPFMA